MARYLTINSTFNPISFDDIMTPALLYKQEYERQQDDIDELYKNNTLRRLRNSNIDSNAYSKYSNYMDSLGRAADDLMSTGKLNANAIRELKRNYNEVIAPYEDKLKKRSALIAEQAKNYSPTKMYSKDFSNVSLDEFNDDMTYRTLDLDDIFKDSAAKILSSYQAEDTKTPEEEINNMYQSYDLSDFSDEQKDLVLDAIVKGRNAAIASMNEYTRKATNEAIKAKADAYRAQAALERASKSGNGRTPKVETHKIRRTLDDGTQVIITEKDGKYYDKDGVEITDPNDINELNKQSKKYGNPKFTSVGIDVYLGKGVDGTYKTIRNSMINGRPMNQAPYIDEFNDAEELAIINNSNELLSFINENATNNNVIDALKAILGVDNNGNIELGWFVNNKRIIVKRFMVGSKECYGIKIENKKSPAQQQQETQKDGQQKEQSTQTEEQQSSVENTESAAQKKDTTDNSSRQPSAGEADDDKAPIGAD